MASETTNTPVLSQSLSGLAHVANSVARVASDLYVSLQTAQMTAALNRMTDTQLAALGTERKDIFSYAESLIRGQK